MVGVQVALYRLAAVRVVVVGWMDLYFVLAVRRRWVEFHGQGSMGCVPGRCFAMVSSCCGSNQSLCAMVLPLASGLPFFPSSGGLGVDDGGRRTVLASTKDPKGLFVIFLFSRDLCVSLVGQLSLLYSSSVYLYLGLYVYAVLLF
ncbi:unnamed protein product [Urochloa humidicola]